MMTLKQMTMKTTVMLAIVFSGLLFFLKSPVGNTQNFTGVTSDEFHANYMDLLTNGKTLIIDGRSVEMFSEDHLQNAICIDANDEDLEDQLRVYADEPLIVLYCTTNKRTGKILETLEKFYTGKVIYINDGIRGWKTNGYPVVSNPENMKQED